MSKIKEKTHTRRSMTQEIKTIKKTKTRKRNLQERKLIRSRLKNHPRAKEEKLKNNQTTTQSKLMNLTNPITIEMRQ